MVGSDDNTDFSEDEYTGFAPDWAYWLGHYELDVLALVNLSLGLNPYGGNTKGLAHPKMQVSIKNGKHIIEQRTDILLSHIGQNGQPFIGQPELFGPTGKLSKIHTRLKLMDAVTWMQAQGWDLPPEMSKLSGFNKDTDLLERIAEGSSLAQSDRTDLKGLDKVNQRKHDAQGMARILAENYWIVDKNISIGVMAERVWNELRDYCQDDLPDHASTVKAWIKSVAPPEASRPGRPKK
jgi:hypothetical protein